jgi:hypothetical protein
VSSPEAPWYGLSGKPTLRVMANKAAFSPLTNLNEKQGEDMKKLFTILAILALLMVPCISMAATMSDSELAAITGAGVEIDISPLLIGVSLDSMSWGDYNVLGFTGNGSTGYTVYNQAGSVNILPLSGSMHVAVNGMSGITYGFYNVNLTTGAPAVPPAYATPGAMGYDTITTADMVVDISVGTVGGSGLLGPTGKYSVTGGITAVQLGFVNGVHVTLDGFVADIVLDATNAAFNDWQAMTTGIPLYNTQAGFNNFTSSGGTGGTLASKTLGTFGIAGMVANVTGQPVGLGTWQANSVIPVPLNVLTPNIPFYVTISAH